MIWKNQGYTHFKEWFFQSDYDFETAKAMFSTSRYIYCVFMCHLSLEKALKALVVKNLNIVPPKTHNLLYLVNMLHIVLQSDTEEFLFRINDAAIPTRYPQDLSNLIKFYTKEITSNILEQTNKVLIWIKQQ